MYGRLIRNDMAKSKLITVTTMAFIAAAATLVFLATAIVINLWGAIDTLMTQAKTPHFMQMHSGVIDHERLEAFAEQNDYVDAFQVLEFLNVEGSEIIMGENSLADSVQDNGLSTQSGKFDFLLDLEGNIINAKKGELYVPLCYMKDGNAKVGDRAILCGKEFIVAGFLRDSQMNSTLSSSKRFLVSETDYVEIKDYGSIEYLVEFRLKELSSLGAFEAAYISAGLEANGPTITYPLFKVINAISDGLMIGVILLVSVLVVAIALMCIRFTLLAKIEEDYREIGVMKAIGLRVADIKKIYLTKYMVVAAVGCVLGFSLAFAFRGVLLQNIWLYMGESGNAPWGTFFGALGVLLVFFVITAYVSGVLKRFRRISAAEALRLGSSNEKSTGSRHFCLSRNNLLNVNLFLGVKDVLARKRLYGTMLVVLVLSAFIIIVPLNLYSTLSSESFIEYMGIGKSDILIDIQQTDHLSEKADAIVKMMASDNDISKYAVLTSKAFKIKKADGSEENIKIQLGDHSVFPIKYSEGRAPTSEDEIALSVINADELGCKVGDVLIIVAQGKERNLTVCGIYSDITNGGKTAKAAFDDDSSSIMWCSISMELSDKTLIGSKLSAFSREFSYAKIMDIDGYSQQTFGPTISSIGLACFVAIAIALILSVLVTLLFMKMLVAKDSYPIAIMKSLGFTHSDIRLQYVSRSVFVLVVGFVLGTLLANTLGESIAGMIFTSFGAASFKFEINGPVAYFVCPLMMACSVFVATLIGTSSAGRIKLSENIKE